MNPPYWEQYVCYICTFYKQLPARNKIQSDADPTLNLVQNQTYPLVTGNLKLADVVTLPLFGIFIDSMIYWSTYNWISNQFHTMGHKRMKRTYKQINNRDTTVMTKFGNLIYTRPALEGLSMIIPYYLYVIFSNLSSTFMSASGIFW